MPSFASAVFRASCALAFVGAPAPWAGSADTLELAAAKALRDSSPVSPARQILSQTELRRYQNLADALKRVPGFRVRTQSGLGGYAETRFRGADGREIAVFLDGVPLNSSEEPAADLGKIPVLSIREMTVDKSGLSADGDGSGGEGGGPAGSGLASIRLSTRLQGNSPVSVTGRLSSFGGREGAAAAKAGGERGAVYLAAGAQSSRNDYPFPSDNGTLFNPSDDAYAGLRNNGYTGGFLNLGWRADAGNGGLLAAALQLDGHRKRFPGTNGWGSRAFTDHGGARLNVHWKGVRSGVLARAFSADAALRTSRDVYADPGQSLGYRSFDQERRFWAASAGSGVEGTLPGGFAYGLGARAGFERMDADEAEGFRPYDVPRARRVFAEPALRVRKPIASGWSAVLEASQRFDRLESDKVLSSPGGNALQPFRRDAVASTQGLGLQWNGGCRGGCGLLAEFRRHEKQPSFYELLGDNNGIQSHPDLKAQTAYAASLQGAARFGPARISGGPFYHAYLDPIRLAPLGPSNFLSFQNGAGYQAWGWETRFDAEGRRWSLGEALTLASPSIRQGALSGNIPQYFSRLENNAEAALALISDLWLDVNWEYRSAYYVTDRNLAGTRRAPESLAGAGLAYRKRRFDMSLRVDNLFDAYYRDFAYSPKSGRRFSAELSLNP